MREESPTHTTSFKGSTVGLKYGESKSEHTEGSGQGLGTK
jgi:hypothetical protein